MHKLNRKCYNYSINAEGWKTHFDTEIDFLVAFHFLSIVFFVRIFRGDEFFISLNLTTIKCTIFIVIRTVIDLCICTALNSWHSMQIKYTYVYMQLFAAEQIIITVIVVAVAAKWIIKFLLFVGAHLKAKIKARTRKREKKTEINAFVSAVRSNSNRFHLDDIFSIIAYCYSLGGRPINIHSWLSSLFPFVSFPFRTLG